MYRWKITHLGRMHAEENREVAWNTAGLSSAFLILIIDMSVDFSCLIPL